MKTLQLPITACLTALCLTFPEVPIPRGGPAHAAPPSSKAKPTDKGPKSKKRTAKRPTRPVNTSVHDFDVRLVKEHLQVATDGKGRYIAYLPLALQRKPPKGYPRDASLFYSPDGKQFFRNHAGRSARGKQQWTLDFRDGRHPENGRKKLTSVIRTEDGGATLEARCNERRAKFTRLDADARKTLLAKATFKGRHWNREIVAFGRDDRGIYYLVDNAMYPPGSGDYRVYRGMRGKMKLLPLKGVADDSHGNVFSTKSGSLRLVLTNGAVQGRSAAGEWLRGRRRTTLTMLSVWMNAVLIFNELGPYIGDRQGTVCDDI